MFDFAWPELALIGVVAVLVIGPKDMPVAIRAISNVLKKGRKLAGEFQTHVDEMVRDADMGEARDQLRQLRSFNVRGQIMKALDEDGSIKRTLEQKPFDMAPSRPVELASPTMAALPVQPVGTHPSPVYGAGDRPWHGADATDAPEDPVAAAADPAPSIVPPRLAGRLRAERAKPPPPAFLPPRLGAPARTARPASGGDGGRQVSPPMPGWVPPQASFERPDPGLT